MVATQGNDFDPCPFNFNNGRRSLYHLNSNELVSFPFLCRGGFELCFLNYIVSRLMGQ
jgi:hypothetical protein